MERQPLLGKLSVSSGHVNSYSDSLHISSLRRNTTVKVYKRRWYIVFIFSLICIGQGCVWNTFGPISQSTADVYGWPDSTIALMTNWGCITFILSSVFFSWLLEVKGLRVSVIITATLLFVGTGVRCISSDNAYFTWLAHAGAIISGFAGPIVMSAPTTVSATWFPANGRTTATAIMVICNYFGVALSFIIGPLIVVEANIHSTNGTNTIQMTSLKTTVDESFGNLSRTTILPYPLTNSTSIISTKNDIMLLMYIEAGFHAVILLCILIYFPKQPPLPPTVSASTDRVSFVLGLKKAFCEPNLWIMAIPFGLGLGVYNCWNAVLDVNLAPLGIQQSEAGWIGFYSVLAGCIAALITSWVSDHVIGYMKILCIIIFAASGCVGLWLALIVDQYIAFNTAQVYAAIILGGLLIYTCIAQFFEMACESAYPIAEAVVSGMLALVNNVFGFVFLLLFYIPNIGNSWMNWCLTGSLFFSVLLLMFAKVSYHRLEIDLPSTDESLYTAHQHGQVNTQSMTSQSGLHYL